MRCLALAVGGVTGVESCWPVRASTAGHLCVRGLFSFRKDFVFPLVRNSGFEFWALSTHLW